MKEAQKTLDTALDIQNEEVGEVEDKASAWNSWKIIKSDSDSKLSDKMDPNSASMWGSFSGSFFEAGSVGQGVQVETVSHQPKRSDAAVVTMDSVNTRPLASAVVTSAPISSSCLVTSSHNVAPSSSSVLGGEEVLTNSWEEEEKFSSSRLVVTDRDTTSPDSPSVELVSVSPSNQSPSSTTSQELQSVDLATSSMSQSSIDVISPR